MKKTLIKNEWRKPVLIYKMQCLYCRTPFPTCTKNRVTCGQAECRYKHSLVYQGKYNHRPVIRRKIKSYMRDYMRDYMYHKYHALIMLKYLESLAFK